MIKKFRIILLGVLITLITALYVSAEESTSYFENFTTFSGGKLTAGVIGYGEWINGNWGQAQYLKPRTDESGNAVMNVVPDLKGDAYANLYVYAKYRFSSPADEMVHIAFKFKGEELDSTKETYIDIYPEAKSGGDGLNVFYIGTSGLYELLSGSKEGIVKYEKNRIYAVNLIVDISNMKFFVYIDGILRSTTDLPESFTANSTTAEVVNVRDIRFRMGGLIDWFDDFKISKISHDDFIHNSIEVDEDENKVIVQYNSSISEATPTQPDDYKLINLLNGEMVVAESVVINHAAVDSIELQFSEPFESGTEYRLLFPEEFKSVNDKRPTKDVIFAVADSGLYVEKIRFIDYKNEIYTLAEEKIPAKVNRIEIFLSDAINSEYLEKEYFALKTDKGETLDYEINPGENNSVILNINGYLYGDEEFVIDISDEVSGNMQINKGYKVKISTLPGELEVKSFEIINSEGKASDIGDIAEGTLEIQAEVIKTIRKKYDLTLSYSAWNEKVMKGFDYLKITIPENTTSAVYKLKITAGDLSEITAVKGFLWDDFMKMNAISDEIILN